MNYLDAARSFICVADSGSFARAAERLGLSGAAVSRHLSYMEDSLGVRLLHRTTRTVRLTDSGQMCLDRLKRILGDIDDLAAVIQSGRDEPQGVLRINSTTLFWMHRIAPALPAFMKRYPKITLQVALSERVVDLIADGYDLALQIERPAGNSLVTRSLLTLTRVVCAAPSYLAGNGTPFGLEDLAGHNCLLYAYSSEQVEWRFWDNQDQEHHIRVSGSLRSSDANTLRLATLAGIGICRAPRFLLEDDLANGNLVQLLPEMRSVDPELWVVYPTRKQLASKVRAFINFLDELCARPFAMGANPRPLPSTGMADRAA